MPTLTINLPEHLEDIYRTAAETQGITIEALIERVLRANGPETTEPDQFAELIEEDGIPVLRGGAPLAAAVDQQTLETIRHQREFSWRQAPEKPPC